MKILSAALGLLLLASQAWAVGTCTTSIRRSLTNASLRVVTFTWTDDTNGTTCTLTRDANETGWVYMADTDPGATAPTDNYDFALADAVGSDLDPSDLLLNRDEANTERVNLTQPYVGTITATLSGNSVNNATGVLRLWLLPDN
jgi:hypothetical protein